jgi:hypothetical protein
LRGRGGKGVTLLNAFVLVTIRSYLKQQDSESSSE